MSLAQIKSFFDVVDIAPEDWPVRCLLALPNSEAERAWGGIPVGLLPQNGRVAGGRGLSLVNAELSVLGEAAELASSVYWGNEDVIKSPAPVISDITWNADLLNGFSSKQRSERLIWNLQLAETDWIPGNHPVSATENWVVAKEAWSDEPVLVPAETVFIALREKGDPMACAVADSSGCAAGETIEAAKVSAVYELIERDATGRWWYGKRQRPCVDPTLLGSDFAAVLAWFNEQGREFWLYDITTDIGVPVVAAVSEDPNSGAISVGFAAESTISSAGQKAMLEMCQMMLLVEAAQKTGRAQAGLTDWLANVRRATEPIGPVNEMPSESDVSGSVFDLRNVYERLQHQGIRLAFADMTRPTIGIPVIRAISPDLCHWKPRFGRSRLLATDTLDQSVATSVPNNVLLRL